METQQASCKTILLIDDEDYILQIVEACIENFSNWRPALAASGDEGLAAAAKAKPDAILHCAPESDIHMVSSHALPL